MPTNFVVAVFDSSTGQSISGVIVSLPERGISITTNAQGISLFGIIESGTVLVRFTHPQYFPLERTKLLEDLTSTELVVGLTKLSDPEPPGEDECIPGQQTCQGGRVRRCVREEDGVARWQDGEACQEQLPIDLLLFLAAGLGIGIIVAVLLKKK